MEDMHAHYRPSEADGGQSSRDLDRVAWSATLHCLTGCGAGEISGMVIGTALGWDNGATIALAVALAFLFGYALTIRPLLRDGFKIGTAMRFALAADTASITIMAIVDNAIMLIIPGAMVAGLDSVKFWASLAIALAIAVFATFPVNRWLITRDRGHALVHSHHKRHDAYHPNRQG